MLADVGAGNNTQTAYKAGCEIRDDIAIQVFHQHDVELIRIHDELHASVIDDLLIVLDHRIVHRHMPEAFQEQPVRFLHDVRLVHGGNFFAAVLAGKLEGKYCDACARFFRHDFQRLDDARYNFVFEARIQSFGVLTHDDEVHISKSRRHAGKIPHRAEVGIEVENFAQTYIYAFEATADRRCNGPLQCNLVAAHG